MIHSDQFDTRSIQNKFRELFEAEPLLVRSPGRVNIIGENTDYNEGFVLPAAINKAIYLAIGKRSDDKMCLYAQEYEEGYEFALSKVAPTEKEWPNYILGVVAQLQKNRYLPGGFNLVIGGDVPLGAGLSSSAAVECATAFALNELFSLHIGKMEMVKMAQMAEHEFAGVRCGIMDQFASMFGKSGHAIKLDYRTLEYEYVPLDLQDYKIVLFNTNVKHSLSSSEYNIRRQQCEQAVAWIKEHHPHINSLRDVNMEMLDCFVLPRDAVVYKRGKYVVEEIARLKAACEDLKKGDLISLGKKMFQTHTGLREEFEVSCKELDFLVGYVKDDPAVVGARMMGGGFGGCTINLVKEKAVDDLVEKIAVDYLEKMNLKLSAYIAKVEEGSRCIPVYPME
jgi:galactokinase